jgi:hypothetical protein
MTENVPLEDLNSPEDEPENVGETLLDNQDQGEAVFVVIFQLFFVFSLNRFVCLMTWHRLLIYVY